MISKQLPPSIREEGSRADLRGEDDRFMMGLASNPEMVRNVAVVGHLHHGKTALLDMLVHETHVIDVDADRQVRTPISPISLPPSPR